MKRVLLFLAIIGLLNNAVAQNPDLGTWNILNLKYNVNNKWSVFTEAQLRSLKFYNNYHYYEFKGGISYNINKNAALTVGAGTYQTYKENGNFIIPKNNNEFRIWPQLVLSQYFSNLKIEQRYRTEFRFTNDGFRNRFRYRLGLSYPLGKELDGYKPFQISVSDELFFTDNEPYFERNRALIALNYKPSKATALQVGYLNQFDYRINDETGRDFLQIAYFIEFSRK